VQGLHPFNDRGDKRPFRFGDDNRFTVIDDFFFPPVQGVYIINNIDARDKPLFNERPAYTPCLFRVFRGDVN